MASIDEHLLKCPTCDGYRSQCILHEHRTAANAFTAPPSRTVHQIVACGGCNTVVHRRLIVDLDGTIVDSAQWPKATVRRTPDWFNSINSSGLDPAIHRVLHEVYLAIEGHMYVLAASGLRTVVDKAAVLLGAQEGQNFREKLDQLAKTAKIADPQKRQLEVLIDAGGAAVHRGWVPAAAQIHTLTGIVERLMLDHFVLPSRIDHIAGSIPPRQRKTKLR